MYVCTAINACCTAQRMQISIPPLHKFWMQPRKEKKRKMMWVVSTKNPFHPYFSQRQVGPIISMHDRATCPPLYPLSLCQTRQGLLALHRLTADLRCKSKRTKLEVYSNISIKRQHNRFSKSSPALSLFLPPGPSECQRYTFAKCFIALLFLSKRKGGGRSIIAPTGNEEFGRALFLPHEWFRYGSLSFAFVGG